MLSRLRQFVRPGPPELEARAAYRLWAASYPPRAHNAVMQAEENALIALLPDVTGLRVLDLACGSGRYAGLLAAGGARVAGLDLSFEMLSRGERFARAQADLTALPLAEACADCIVCGLAVGHVPLLDPVFCEFARVLKPRGVLVYSDFYAGDEARNWRRTFQSAGRTYAVRHYPRPASEHRAALERAGFALEQVEEVGIPPAQAASDPGAAAFRERWGDTPVALVVRAVRA